MSTDKDALREDAIHWLQQQGFIRSVHDNKYAAALVDSLTALLTASVADAVAQEREACAKKVPTTWLHPMFIDNDKLDGPTTEWICKQIALAIRARTTTPTPEGSPTGSPSPTGGRVPLPSGEQPGVLVVAVRELLAALSDIYLDGYSDQKARVGDAVDSLRDILARQPRADYDAGESGEKI